MSRLHASWCSIFDFFLSWGRRALHLPSLLPQHSDQRCECCGGWFAFAARYKYRWHCHSGTQNTLIPIPHSHTHFKKKKNMSSVPSVVVSSHSRTAGDLVSNFPTILFASNPNISSMSMLSLFYQAEHRAAACKAVVVSSTVTSGAWINSSQEEGRICYNGQRRYKMLTHCNCSSLPNLDQQYLPPGTIQPGIDCDISLPSRTEKCLEDPYTGGHSQGPRCPIC